MVEKKEKDSILGSMFVRIAAFFVLTISFVIAAAGIFGTIVLLEMEVYTKGVTSLIHDTMTRYIWNDVYYVRTLYQEGDMEGIETYLSKRNISMEILDIDVPENEKAVLLWSNYDGTERTYSFNCFTEVYITEMRAPEKDSEQQEETEITGKDANNEASEAYMNSNSESVLGEVTVLKELLFRVYVDESFPYGDEYKNVYDWGMVLQNCIYVIPIAAVIAVFLFLCSFIFLMCSAGHHRGQEGITGGVLYFFHFDVVTVFFGCGAIGILFCICYVINWGGLFGFVFAIIFAAAEIIWCTVYCMEFATELKKGTIFRHTVIGAFLRRFGRSLKLLVHGLRDLVSGLPLVANVVFWYIGFSFVQFMALLFFCMLWKMKAEVLLLCFLEKVVLLPVVLYFALTCKKLQQGSEALAEGDLSYKLDTSKMFLGFREHGENLNRIGDGISMAVEERMRSERLKTELITNVSHDLKTPLTSIINYADLIGTAVAGKGAAGALGGTSEEEPIENGGQINREQMAEYAEVLVRQSRRLKKLLEDLVEASKATTGNLEVHLVPCEISVLLSQAVGEYEQRFAEKELELIVRQPEEPVNIQADSRHIWRVFDNLLNNICKYAQEGTRVYLTVEPRGEHVEIVFRNMSKYPLELSAEELQERFVRGDKSRHMEGNGLGLSIAGSLVDLQNGRMEIVTDGDLFKVILSFPTELLRQKSS